VLITCESSICAFSTYNLNTTLPYYYTMPILISCTCWVLTISVLNIAIFPLLLKLAAQKMKIVWNSLMRSSRLALPRLHIPMDYGVFHCSTSVRESFSLLKDNIYLMIILYSWHLALLWILMFVCMEILFLGTHAMSIGFWSQNWVWQAVMEELRVCVAGVKDERATEAGELSQLIMEISSPLVDLGTLPI
jgi:hypothetical protein